MFSIYTQFGFSSNYSFNKNCTILNFINLISDRANFAVSGLPLSFHESVGYFTRCGTPRLKQISPLAHRIRMKYQLYALSFRFAFLKYGAIWSQWVFIYFINLVINIQQKKISHSQSTCITFLCSKDVLL